jgi:hypothetical protein
MIHGLYLPQLRPAGFANGTLSPLKEPEDAAETAMRFRIPLSIIFLPEEPFYLFKGLSLCLG